MKPIRHIYSENPYQKMWDTFVYFENEPTTKQFLQNIYELDDQENGYKYAFKNTSKFIYFIKQAKEYFFSAEKSSLLVKPLLIYYGMMSLMKAVILSKDPNYPSRTSVLRHGMTTRKLKKNNYQFHDDEIKIQKEGLLPIFYTLTTKNPIEQIVGNKYKMKELLALLPELHESYQRLFHKQTIFPVLFEPYSAGKWSFYIDKNILSFYKNDSTKLLFALNHYSKEENHPITLISEQGKYLTFIWSNVNEGSLHASFYTHPMFIIDYKGKYYLRPFKEDRFLIPEIMIDYMLMYTLGMLCRYDTELWGEIIFSFVSEDMYLINEFVNLSLRKFPNLILNALFDELIIFDGI